MDAAIVSDDMIRSAKKLVTATGQSEVPPSVRTAFSWLPQLTCIYSIIALHGENAELGMPTVEIQAVSPTDWLVILAINTGKAREFSRTSPTRQLTV